MGGGIRGKIGYQVGSLAYCAEHNAVAIGRAGLLTAVPNALAPAFRGMPRAFSALDGNVERERTRQRKIHGKTFLFANELVDFIVKGVLQVSNPLRSAMFFLGEIAGPRSTRAR